MGLRIVCACVQWLFSCSPAVVPWLKEPHLCAKYVTTHHHVYSEAHFFLMRRMIFVYTVVGLLQRMPPCAWHRSWFSRLSGVVFVLPSGVFPGGGVFSRTKSIRREYTRIRGSIAGEPMPAGRVDKTLVTLGPAKKLGRLPPVAY